MKPILISGIQPTGRLHLGNYLGVLANLIRLQNSGKYECFFFIADLHALTENPAPKELQKNIIDLATTFLAIGLSPKKSTLFIQSKISGHTELAWIFNILTPPGEMFRMTQFKDKSANTPNDVNLGLLNYPILMAADILMYNPQFVHVCHDQLQHLELARTLARKFNSRFGKTFNEPKALLTSTPRLMSLDNPTKKMSKSLPSGCLFIDDEPKIMKEKIMRAVTDSDKSVKYDEKNKPAVSNLMLIYKSLSDKSIAEIEKKYQNKGYADFKKDLAKIIIDYFVPFQKKKKELSTRRSPAYANKLLTTAFAQGAKTANAIASKRLLEIKKKIGLVI